MDNPRLPLRSLLGASLAVLGASLLTGCPPNFSFNLPPALVEPSVSDGLRIGEPTTVTLSVRVIGVGAAIESVTADLSDIGGDEAVPLQRQFVNLWSATAEVAPEDRGTQAVEFSAMDEQDRTGTLAIAVTVTGDDDDGDGTDPVLSNPIVSGGLTAQIGSNVTVSVIATDPDGTVEAVVADLSDIGGAEEQTLLAGTDDLWTFTGVVVPGQSGTRLVTFLAIDNNGNTTAEVVEVAVQDAIPNPIPGPIPDPIPGPVPDPT